MLPDPEQQHGLPAAGGAHKAFLREQAAPLHSPNLKAFESVQPQTLPATALLPFPFCSGTGVSQL